MWVSEEIKLSNLELRRNLNEAMDKFELIFGEKIDLENFTEAMQVYTKINSVSGVWCAVTLY